MLQAKSQQAASDANERRLWGSVVNPSQPSKPSQLGQPSRQRPDYDQALKRMLAGAHDGFLQLIAPDVRWLGERSTELPAVARRADLVWEVASAEGERGLLHIELQTQPDADMGERLAEYGVRLWLRDHLPVRSMVVFLRPAETLPTSPFVVQWKGQESLRYSFDVIRLWEIPAERVLDTPHYGLWPLAAVMGNITVESAVGVAERIARAPISVPERTELTTLLVVLSELRLGRRTLIDALRRNPMIDEMIENSALAEEFLEKGISQGMHRMVRRVLEGRFGQLSDDMLAALAAADEHTLDEIGTHAATDTLDQIRARLGLS